jgi:phytoene desaturase
MHRAAAPMYTGRTASPSTAARPSSPRPSCFEELWALCGKTFSDDVDLRPVAPFYRIRFDDGEHLDYSGDPETMRREIARFAPEDVDGYERFMKQAKAIFDVGFTELVDISFSDWTTMLKIAPDLLRLKSYRTVYGLVASYVKNERIRTVLSFHPLLIGGNPFYHDLDPVPDRISNGKWGVHFAMGGTGEIVKGMVRLIEGQGGTVRLNTEVARSTWTGPAGQRRAADHGRSHARRRGGLERRLGLDLPQAAAPEHRRRWTNRRIEKSLLDEPVRLVLRHPPPVPRRRAPHDPAGAALRGC